MIINLDYDALKVRIKEWFGTYHAFAAALGVSDRTLHRWLHNKTAMPLEALCRMVELLEIPDREVEFFFFREKSPPELLEFVETIGRLDSDFFDLVMRYMTCLISMQTNHSAEAVQADDRLFAAIKSGATLSEIVQCTEALELALGIKLATAVSE